MTIATLTEKRAKLDDLIKRVAKIDPEEADRLESFAEAAWDDEPNLDELIQTARGLIRFG